MTTQPTISFIGAGNMASSIIGGLINEGFSSHHIYASDPTAAHLENLHTRYGVQTLPDNTQAVLNADIVLLCVKPQILQAVCTEVAEAVQQKQPLIISIAAGIEISHMYKWLNATPAIVRCMPNTPALIGQGASGLYANSQVSDVQKDQANRIFSAVGITEWVTNEDLLHGVTAISGSGPAYFFMIMEAMESAAAKTGLSPETAHQLTVQTLLGAAEMAKKSKLPPVQLKKNVMSPGGTTERAIQAFETGGLNELFHKAIDAAYARSKELAKSLGEK
jgi:pyrroline-5-carboxylate reductase